MDSAHYAQREMLLPTGEYRQVWVIEHGGRSIWGVTASILQRLHERLREDAP